MIKLIFTDIDGVWTDGSMYYDNFGNEFKRFNTYDAMGVKMCHFFNIPVVIITGEKTQIVKNRACKLNIDDCFQGISDKFSFAKSFLKKKEIDFSEVGYIGDDFNDYLLLKSVKISACPENSHDSIKKIVTHNLNATGGSGCFREFVEKCVLTPEQVNRFYEKTFLG